MVVTGAVSVVRTPDDGGIKTAAVTGWTCMATTEADRLVAALEAPEDAELTPLGPVKVGDRSGSLTVSLPKRTALGVGIEQGTKMETYHDPQSGAFVYLPKE